MVLIGFAAALVLTILLATRGSWKGQGLTVRVVLILAVLAALPLMMFRVSVDIAMEHTPAAVLNVLATFVALLVGIPALVYESRRQGEAPLAEMQESTATGAGATMQTDTGELQDEPATLAEDATPLPGGEATLAGAGAPPSEEATLAPTAWLHFKTGPRAGQSIPVSPGTMTIGRGAENDVVMDDATVSRHHANITYQDGQYYAEDSGSMSGTMVEGRGGHQDPSSLGSKPPAGRDRGCVHAGRALCRSRHRFGHGRWHSGPGRDHGHGTGGGCDGLARRYGGPAQGQDLPA